MSLFHGPSTVMNGLVFYVDAANPRSYPGTGTTWFDLSGLNNHLTLTASPTFSTTGFTFNGSTQYGSKTGFTGLSANPSYTMISWMQFNNLGIGAGVDAPIIWYGGEASAAVASLGQKGTYFCSLHYADDITFTNFTPTTSTWYHAAMTYNSTSRSITLWINSVSTQTATHSNNLNITTTNLGVAADTGGGRRFQGKISTAQIYSREFSSAEILQNFNATRGRYGI